MTRIMQRLSEGDRVRVRVSGTWTPGTVERVLGSVVAVRLSPSEILCVPASAPGIIEPERVPRRGWYGIEIGG